MLDFNKKVDIKPNTPVSKNIEVIEDFLIPIEEVSKVVGMSAGFIQKVVGKKSLLDKEMIQSLLDQDAFSETFIPRSKIMSYLCSQSKVYGEKQSEEQITSGIHSGDAKDLIKYIPNGYVQTVVTSTPYWAMRVYDEMKPTKWADGGWCPLGLEQTPEEFVRHSVEILKDLYDKLDDQGSIFWNIMDTYNTRTQIRGNAAEALSAMKRGDSKKWSEHNHKRYSAGHSYLSDGELCLIPQKIAERASRMGYYVKSMICWAKTASMPEPQNSRVSRNIEYVIHLSKQRAPYFDKTPFRTLDPKLGGRQEWEPDKLSDLWYLPTSAGTDGHGAQFPLQLPGRCIAISSKPNDVIFDPFAGAGTTIRAAQLLGRRFIGFDISEKYVSLINNKINFHQEELTI